MKKVGRLSKYGYENTTILNRMIRDNLIGNGIFEMGTFLYMSIT